MAFPVILIDSNTGSDSLASGAGPSTALTGTAASTSSDGLTVTLDGSPDLTNVATDGSHVIYLADSTAGNRNFGKITAKDNTAKTVTVSNAFGTSLSSLSWAIGGKRDTLFGTNSRKLLENNSSNGDAMPGWTIELASGHDEAEPSAGPVLRRAGDYTDGLITIRGEEGAATKPQLTTAAFANLFSIMSGLWHFDNFNLINTSAGARAIHDARGDDNKFYIKLTRLVIDGWDISGVRAGGNGMILDSCEVKNCLQGIVMDVVSNCSIINCSIHDNSSDGINACSFSDRLHRFEGNLIYNNAIGINFGAAGDGRDASWGYLIRNNTIDGNSGDGINIDLTGDAQLTSLILENNIISNNGGLGIDFTAVADTLISAACIIRNNNTYLNTSGAYKSTTNTYTNSNCPWASDDPGVNPNYVDDSNADFTPQNTSLQGVGYPQTIAGLTNSVWIGAIQPQGSSGGGVSNRGLITGGRL